MSIPRVIHFCWFGYSEKPQEVLDSIRSWEKHMPEYEIIEWNECNFPFFISDYAKEAYDQKKWAFVSDYVRLWALYNYGGIYMDTDVEVFKSFDPFLNHKAFTGFEQIGYPVTAVMGAEKNNPVIKAFLDYYADKIFIFKPYPEMVTNTVIMSNILYANMNIWSNEYQELENITIYPQEYFCADYRNGKTTDNTYAIHKMLGSWAY